MEEIQSDAEGDDVGKEPVDGADLCPYCLAEMKPECSYCLRCGTPVTMTPWE